MPQAQAPKRIPFNVIYFLLHPTYPYHPLTIALMGSGIGRYGFPAFGSVGLCTAVAYLGSQRRTKVRKNIDSVLPCFPF